MLIIIYSPKHEINVIENGYTGALQLKNIFTFFTILDVIKYQIKF
jgi:hypothetical protein